MGFIIAVVVIGALVFPFYVISQLSQLRQELDQLKRLMKVQSGTPHPTSVAPAPSIYGESYEEAVASLQTPAPASAPVVNPLPASVFTPMVPPAPSPVVTWFTEDAFMKVGALLVLIAAGWFVSYAFMNDWIGPVGRIALGIGAGVALMGLGVWRSLVSVSQGAVFTALGMSTALLSVFAARYAYDFFTPGSALLVMFLIVAATAAVSVRFKVEALAVIALLAGAAAPILAHTANPDVLGLHTYLGVLFAGALLVTAILPAPTLVIISLCIAVFYGIPFLEADTLEVTVARLAAFVYAVAFLLFSTAALWRTKAANYNIYLATTIGVGMYVAVWIVATVAPALQGIVSLLWAGGFLFASALLWQALTDKNPAYVQGGMAVAFLALATSYYLDGTLLTVAYLMQITAMVCVALWGLRDIAIARSLAWLYGGVMLMSLPNFIASSWEQSVLHGDFFVLAAIGTVLLFVGTQLAAAGDDTNTDATLITFGSLYGLSLIWLVTHTLFGDQIGTALSLVVYTVIGLGLYIGGLKTSDEYARLFGGAIVGGVVARLLLVDIWELELVFRIIAFFVVGVLLLATAFVSKQKKAALLE